MDLFFVLSGYLIGGLWWREHSRTGRVEAVHFVLRRAFRTIPPYLAMLVISWSAVHATRNEPFDLSYVFMIQNYRLEIPFFLVSWSLCIEEHFYLCLPIVLGIIKKSNKPLFWMFALAGLPLAFRCVVWIINPDVALEPFGFWRTATHFRFEGLVLGVAGGWILRYRPGRLGRLRGWLPTLLVMSCAIVISFRWLPPNTLYVFGYTAIAVAFMLIVGILTESEVVGGAGSRAVRTIALATYSIYLVHALAIHVAVAGAGQFGVKNMLIIWIFMLLLIAAATLAFYLSVERPSIRLRDYLVPGRTSFSAP